jgi:integrase
MLVTEEHRKAVQEDRQKSRPIGERQRAQLNSIREQEKADKFIAERFANALSSMKPNNLQKLIERCASPYLTSPELTHIDDPCFRTIVILAISFGLRISEALGFKWCDVDWLNKTLRIERGVVKQIVDNVKTSHSARTMAWADEVLDLLKNWRQTSPFSESEDWMFASIYKLVRPTSRLHLGVEQPHQGSQESWCPPCKFSHIPPYHRMWLGAVGNTVRRAAKVNASRGLTRHADIRTTMNIYGDAATADMGDAHEKVVRMVLPQVP